MLFVLAQTADPFGGYAWVLGHGVAGVLLFCLIVVAKRYEKVLGERNDIEKELRNTITAKDKETRDKVDGLQKEHRDKIDGLEKEHRESIAKLNQALNTKTEDLLREQVEILERNSTVLVETADLLRRINLVIEAGGKKGSGLGSVKG